MIERLVSSGFIQAPIHKINIKSTSISRTPISQNAFFHCVPDGSLLPGSLTLQDLQAADSRNNFWRIRSRGTDHWHPLKIKLDKKHVWNGFDDFALEIFGASNHVQSLGKRPCLGWHRTIVFSGIKSHQAMSKCRHNRQQTVAYFTISHPDHTKQQTLMHLNLQYVYKYIYIYMGIVSLRAFCSVWELISIIEVAHVS